MRYVVLICCLFLLAGCAEFYKGFAPSSMPVYMPMRGGFYGDPPPIYYPPVYYPSEAISDYTNNYWQETYYMHEYYDR